MKLYNHLAAQIVSVEAGIPLEIEAVDLQTKKTKKTGKDFNAINPKGYIPALVLDNGEVLTEVAVIVQYLADQKPQAGLIPPAGTMQRYRVQEWLNFVGTELHKGLGQMFGQISDDHRTWAMNIVTKRLDYLEKILAGKQYLMGDVFTVADAYMYAVLGYTIPLKISLDKWPTVKAYHQRVGQRPKVQEAQKAYEELNKAAA